MSRSFLMPTYKPLPVTFVRGSGMHLYDEKGRDYLDFVAGVAVNALGHAHPEVTQAIADQASRLVHTSNLYHTEASEELAEKLCGLLGWGDGRVFFANSGAEANECALKLVRRWARSALGPKRYETVAFEGSFHGRTFAALAATGQPAKHAPFLPLPDWFRHLPYDDSPLLASFVARRSGVCSVLAEPILGEAGVVVPSRDFLAKIRSICDAHGLAFIDDEVQTGLGRPGRWFGFQHSVLPAEPDVVTLAKALGGGLPMGACIARGPLAEAFGPGEHASTMGGGPLCCTASLAVLGVIERDGLVARAASMGEHLRVGLEGLVARHEAATAVRGQGLLLALQLGGPDARRVAEEALGEGLLVNDVTASAVRLCPPLVAAREDCDQAVAVLDKVLARI